MFLCGSKLLKTYFTMLALMLLSCELNGEIDDPMIELAQELQAGCKVLPVGLFTNLYLLMKKI